MKNLINHSSRYQMPEGFTSDEEANRNLNIPEAESQERKDQCGDYFNERLTVAMYRAHRLFKAVNRYGKLNQEGDVDTALNPQETAVIKTLPYVLHFIMQFMEEVLYRVAADEDHDPYMPGHRIDNVDIMFMIPAIIGMANGGAEMLEAQHRFHWHPGFNENTWEGGASEHPFYGRQAADVGERVVNQGMSGAMMFSSLIHDRAKEYGMDTQYDLLFASLSACLVEIEGHFVKGGATDRERETVRKAVSSQLNILNQIKNDPDSDGSTPSFILTLIGWQIESLLGDDLEKLLRGLDNNNNDNNQD